MSTSGFENVVSGMSAVSATYFDGATARGHSVLLAFSNGAAVLYGDGVQRSIPIGTIEIADALGVAPRLIRFPDGAYCEIADRHGFERLLAEQGIGKSAVARWEESRPWILLAVLVLLLVLGGTYRYGVPALANVVANRLPPVLVQKLSAQAIEILDDRVFEGSDLPAETQARVSDQFARLRLPNATNPERYRVLFRKSELLGANAMAFPSGAIVLTDSLVNVAQDDRELLSVLAHEAGHVEKRHTLRQILQNSAIALFITWYAGDVSTLIAAAPTALLQARYSRDFEREADDYAAEALRSNGIPLRHFAVMLERLESAGAHATRVERTNALNYLSTHPPTAERLERLRAR